jgi:sulfate adenylyltransferase
MINKIFLDENEYYNLINLHYKLYKPLNTFSNLEQVIRIQKKKKILGIKWPLPILLNSKKTESQMKRNCNYGLFYKKKKLGHIKCRSIFFIKDFRKYNRLIFNTNNSKHPSLLKNSETPYISGEIYVYNNKIDKNFKKIVKLKKTIRKIKNSVVFSSRNLPHKGHELILENLLKKNLKVFFVILNNSHIKFKLNLILKSLNILYKKNITPVVLNMPSYFAGPREAFFQSIIFQNIGFKYFVVGRDHAGIKNFYGNFASQKIFNYKNKTKIKIIKNKEPYLCLKCNNVFFKNLGTSLCDYCYSKIIRPISGSEVRKFILNKDYKKLNIYLNKKISTLFIKS